MEAEMDEQQARTRVAATARMVARAGLTEAFGHVSARLGDGMAITSVRPFVNAVPEDVILVDDLHDPPSGGGTAPLEVPMHAAVYLARDDVGAICRGHPRSVVAWGIGTDELPLLHGLGGLAGITVLVHDDVELISTLDQARDVAETLGGNHAVLLRANGCLAVGAELLEAVTRMYFLEERARVALTAPIEQPPGRWGARFADSAKELPRAMAWMDAAFGSE